MDTVSSAAGLLASPIDPTEEARLLHQSDTDLEGTLLASPHQYKEITELTDKSSKTNFWYFSRHLHPRATEKTFWSCKEEEEREVKTSPLHCGGIGRGSCFDLNSTHGAEGRTSS